ncbi:hypothetical protein FV139_04840 [Parahaliea maris]|uniref:ABC-2 type transport system permease protein n=1 Tax=Parahaliea maris TaxID=2716870 RepID=A0A5C9A573_9GAMM|nr:ABC-2 transporter permease [Parahaliea maris]TXS95229.1 hypothetical protein FV139_04840 [Parahaliea maris]
MSNGKSSRWFTLIQRELQEYRVSLVWTPVCAALLLCALVLTSVLVANRISVVGQAFMEVVTQDENISSMNITIHIDDDAEGDVNYKVERTETPADEEDWNFSRKWSFKPKVGDSPAPPSELVAAGEDYAFNAVLGVINVLMVVILMIVTVNYLLGSLYDDRRDRSILFWKSMPVSEWEVVLSKLAVALLVAPAIYLAVALLTQLVCTGLSMLMVWRMDMDPFEQILGNVNFPHLVFMQVAGWVLTALWIAPVYAWMLMASAAARRSPFLTAAVPVVVLILAEELFFGSEYLRRAIGRHIPEQVVGAGLPVPAEMSSLLLGLVCAALFLAATVWLRRHRWEI